MYLLNIYSAPGTVSDTEATAEKPVKAFGLLRLIFVWRVN